MSPNAMTMRMAIPKAASDSACTVRAHRQRYIPCHNQHTPNASQKASAKETHLRVRRQDGTDMLPYGPWTRAASPYREADLNTHHQFRHGRRYHGTENSYGLHRRGLDGLQSFATIPQGLRQTGRSRCAVRPRCRTHPAGNRGRAKYDAVQKRRRPHPRRNERDDSKLQTNTVNMCFFALLGTRSCKNTIHIRFFALLSKTFKFFD